MSPRPTYNEVTNSLDGAEKGTLTTVINPLPASLSPNKGTYTLEVKNGSLAATPIDKKVPIKTEQPPPADKPKPKAKKYSRWIRWKVWFNTYRKLFTFCFSINMVGIGLAASGVWTYPIHRPAPLVLGNLMTAILMRNEVFGRILYWLVNTLFAKWPPLWFRLGCTSVLQHLGGIHSGCALSGCLWLLLNVIDNFRNHTITNDSVLISGTITSCAVIVSVLSAFPWVRNTHHNVFERHHRFIGWLGLISTWIFVLLSDTFSTKDQRFEPSGIHILKQQEFYYVSAMTVLIALPWICVREVEIDIELPSPKVAIIRFERGMQQGLLGRVSRSRILEYHAFGIISEGTHSKYHYMICGVQGDFTRSLVNDPPRTLWSRELKFAGVSNTSTLYKRGVRICTGTGLGAALSTCLQSPYWYLIWIGSDQEKTFGPTIATLIHRHLGPERLLLWDSKQRGGRPDTMKILKEAYDYWQGEVVFITSNYQGNYEIMHGCKEAGIPAFGTLWDF